MKRLKIGILFLTLIIYLFSSALLVPSLAAAHINSYCYNSHTVFAEDIRTVNAHQYADYTIILPGEIISQGGGVGLENNSAFSHNILYLKKGLSISNIGTCLETDSATYRWIKYLDGRRPLLAVGYNLENGTIIASYWDTPAEIVEDLTVGGGTYSGAAIIEPGLVVYGGRGITSGNFSHVLKVTCGGRVTSEMGGEGDIQWQLAAGTGTEEKWLIIP